MTEPMDPRSPYEETAQAAARLIATLIGEIMEDMSAVALGMHAEPLRWPTAVADIKTVADDLQVLVAALGVAVRLVGKTSDTFIGTV